MQQPLVAAGDNLYYLVLSKGRSGCTNWLSGQPCPENRIAAWYTDDTSGRQKWLLSPVGDNIYTINLPQGRTSCDTYLTSSTCDINSAEGAGLTSFVNSDTGSGFERWLITPVSGSSPTSTSSSSPSPSSGESSPSSGESSPSSGESSPPSSPMSQTSPVTAPSAVASGTSVSKFVSSLVSASGHALPHPNLGHTPHCHACCTSASMSCMVRYTVAALQCPATRPATVT